MKYTIVYSCVSHIGFCRKNNQDNLICRGEYIRSLYDRPEPYRCDGTISPQKRALFGVFDGMGGEECGEVASFLAAKAAHDLPYRGDPMDWLQQYCEKANYDICQYMQEHKIKSMGTTAALLLFSEQEVSLCNIGDSRVYLLSGGEFREISEAHVSVAAYGVKPPLSQNLGIKPSEFLIHPYFARGSYHDKDLFLICSDGLTDMLTMEEIECVMKGTPFSKLSNTLLQESLNHGGKDNVTIILCQIKRERAKLKQMLFRSGS